MTEMNELSDIRNGLLASVAGEEDPGASADVVAAIIAQGAPRRHAQRADSPRIEIKCVQGGDRIAVDVCGGARVQSASELLALVVAHHTAIADAAWAWCKRTGASCIAFELSERRDGGFSLQRRQPLQPASAN